MKCRDCRFMQDVGAGLYVCSNENSMNYMEYTGLCCEDDCEDGEEDEY